MSTPVYEEASFWLCFGQKSPLHWFKPQRTSVAAPDEHYLSPDAPGSPHWAAPPWWSRLGEPPQQWPNQRQRSPRLCSGMIAIHRVQFCATGLIFLLQLCPCLILYLPSSRLLGVFTSLCSSCRLWSYSEPWRHSPRLHQGTIQNLLPLWKSVRTVIFFFSSFQFPNREAEIPEHIL